MANRYNNKNSNNMGPQRRNMGYNNFDRDNFDRPRYNVNPWQGGVVPNSGGVGPTPSTEATIALASNLINNLLQSRQNPMPSLLDINVRRDFGPNYMRDERFGPNKIYGRNMQMGGQMNRRVMSGGRNDRMMNKIRRPMRPNVINKAKSVPKSTQEIPKETSELKAETVTESENVSNAVVKEEKRDWKQENPDGEQTTPVKEDENDEKSAENQAIKKNDGVKTEFDDIASKYLECHICEKRMWDGRSFDNHIKGRVHNIMMDKTKQSYQMTADAMRQDLKIQEMKRSKRGFIPGAKKVFCAMCGLYVFYAAAHRRSPGHQKLKKYLHPSCNTCRKEFPTRIELDEHRLTAPHLRLLQEKQKDVQARSKPEVVMITTLQEELAQVRPMHEMKLKKAPSVKKDEEGDAEGTPEENGEQVKEESETKLDGNEEADSQEEEKILLLDYKEGDDLTNMTRENLPRYQTDRSVGISYVCDFTCKQCTLCKKYFDTDETAEVHLRTWKHFQAYIRLIHSKGNFKANQETGIKRESTTDGLNEDDGSWKRRKIETEDDEIAEEEILNGKDSINDDSVCDDSVLNDSLLSETNETDDMSINNTIQDTSDIAEESSFQQVVEVETVEKPRVMRGRGRGRGNRARRGSRA